MQNLSAYILHPEKLDRDTLYELRMILAKYPYFDAARMLMLRNLYLLHDIEFGKELRKAALYLKNRRVLFELMEGYGAPSVENDDEDISVDRTMSLINAFLETLPEEKLSLEAEGAAAVDYASAYLGGDAQVEEVPRLRSQELIDDFLASGNEKISLQLTSDVDAENQPSAVVEVEEQLPETSFFTETLANIYIKQQKYDKALEIIKRLCLEYPNKNRYFADQIRFLEKVIKFSKKN